MNEETMYLVQMIDAETAECYCKLLTEVEIINLEDSMDYNEGIAEYQVFDISTYGECAPITVKGKHCHPKFPGLIVAYRKDGSVAFSGEGNEH